MNLVTNLFVQAEETNGTHRSTSFRTLSGSQIVDDSFMLHLANSSFLGFGKVLVVHS